MENEKRPLFGGIKPSYGRGTGGGDLTRRTAAAPDEKEIIVCALYKFSEDIPSRYTPEEARLLMNESSRLGYLICTREYALDTTARIGPHRFDEYMLPGDHGAVSFTLGRTVLTKRPQSEE